MVTYEERRLEASTVQVCPGLSKKLSKFKFQKLLENQGLNAGSVLAVQFPQKNWTHETPHE
jgi:hypothetical protein